MIVRGLIVAVATAALAVQVVRSAIVQKFAEVRPQAARSAWPDHPKVRITTGLVSIAEATRDRRPVPDQVIRSIEGAATRAPLEPEPFLVRGVQAQLGGDLATAERAFRAAQRRDPRSLPAAYFLANHYVQLGDPDRGLVQVATLSRLAPGGARSIAPYVAAYARDRSNWPRLRALFRAEPKLRDATLDVLAEDARNAPAIVGLTERSWRMPETSWVRTMLAALVRARDYSRARAIWAEIAGVGNVERQWIFDPGFSSPRPPPPFNWLLTSSPVGLAERQPGGRLHVIFYGQENGVLARQLLLLPPGSYRLAMRVTGSPDQARAFSWTLVCDSPAREIAAIPLDRAQSGLTFAVPANCPAQWIELRGTAADVPRQGEVTISGLSLSRAGGANV